MKTGFGLLGLLFLIGCTCEAGEKTATGPTCTEFQHKTRAHGEPITCQMVWCTDGSLLSNRQAGPATLWCEPTVFE